LARDRELTPSILLFAKGYLPDDGGIERYSAEVARAYAQNGFRVYVLTQTTSGPRVARDGKVRVIDLGAKSQLQLLLLFAIYGHRLAKRSRAKFVHATTWRVAVPAFVMPKRPPLMVTVHGREIFVLPKALLPLMRLTLKKAEKVAVVSETIRKAAEATVDSRDWAVVWNGSSFADYEALALPMRTADDAAKVHIFTLCRLVERKNILGAVRAIALLVGQGVTNIHYTIAGGGPEREAIEQLVRERGVQGYVTLLGRVEDEAIPDLYRKSDIFLHPQIDIDGDVEGFGLVIADAMSLGLCVIAGKEGGPSDFVIEGQTGLLVDGRNDAEIANALAKVVRDQPLRRRIADTALDWARRNLSWTAASKKMIEEMGAT